MRGFLLREIQEHFCTVEHLLLLFSKMITDFWFRPRSCQPGLLGYHWPWELMQENTYFHPGLFCSLSKHCDAPQHFNCFRVRVWGCTSSVRSLTPWINSDPFLCSPSDNLCLVNPHWAGGLWPPVWPVKPRLHTGKSEPSPAGGSVAFSVTSGAKYIFRGKYWALSGLKRTLISLLITRKI